MFPEGGSTPVLDVISESNKTRKENWPGDLLGSLTKAVVG